MHMELFNAIDLRLRAAEIVVTGQGPRREEILSAARKIPPLDHIVLHAPIRSRAAGHAPGATQARAAAEPQAFVCVAETCSLPVTDAAGLMHTLAAVRQPTAVAG